MPTPLYVTSETQPSQLAGHDLAQAIEQGYYPLDNHVATLVNALGGSPYLQHGDPTRAALYLLALLARKG